MFCKEFIDKDISSLNNRDEFIVLILLLLNLNTFINDFLFKFSFLVMIYIRYCSWKYCEEYINICKPIKKYVIAFAITSTILSLSISKFFKYLSSP